MLAGIELLVVGVARPDGIQADAALLGLSLSPSPEPDSSGSTSRSDILPPQLLHAILDVHDTEPAELAAVPLPEDLDVLVGLLSRQVGQLGQQLSDESVSVPDPLALLRDGAGLHCSRWRCWRRRDWWLDWRLDWRLPDDGANWTLGRVRVVDGKRRRLPDDGRGSRRQVGSEASSDRSCLAL